MLPKTAVEIKFPYMAYNRMSIFKKIYLLVFISVNLFATNVLILNSYQDGFRWTEIQKDEIVRNLKNSDIKNLNIFIEFMDTKVFRPTPRKEKNLLNFLKIKYEKNPFDIVLTTDDNALSFVKKFKKEKIFKNSKVFFSGVNNLLLSDTLDRDFYAGVFEIKDSIANFKLAKKAVKNLKTFYLLSDDTVTGKKEVRYYKEELSKYKDVNFVYLESDDIDKILNQLGVYDEKSAMMLLTFTGFKRNGKHIDYRQVLKILDAYYDKPMLVHTNIYASLNDTNIIGGNCTDARKQGEISSKMALKYLKGDNMRDIGFVFQGGNRVYFNIKNLAKFGLTSKDFDIKSAILVNKPVSFYRIFKNWIYVFFAILFLVILFIIALGKKNLALRKALENFELLAETSFGGIVIYDSDSRIIYANQRVADLTQYGEKEMIGMDAFSFVHPDDLEMVKEHVLRDINDPYDVRILKKDKSFFYTSLRGKNIVYAGKNMRIATIIDITDRKIQEQQIEEMNESLKQKIKKALIENTKQLRLLQQQSKLASMGEMIGAIAHQWRQPLNAININIQNLDDDFEDGLIDKEFIDKFISKNVEIIEFMSKTIDDFRNFYRLDKVKRVFNVKKAIDDVINIQDVQLKNYNIELIIDGYDYEIDGFESEFKQVILNLINNAKDSLLYNNIEDAKIVIETEPNRIVVMDNGGGIPDDIVDRIFEPYFTTKDQGKGTGLGLYMSKMIIEENMNGKLTARNRNGWAVFEIITQY